MSELEREWERNSIDPVRVVAAAIWDTKTCVIHSMPVPARHCNILNAIYDPTRDRKDNTLEQGFLSSDGRFLSRKQALAFAIRAGQVKEGKWPPELYTEDLW